MHSSFYHIQINIDPKHISFYKEFMSFLGWSVIFEEETMAGYKSRTHGDLWFLPATKNMQTDYDAIGVNHISLRVEQAKDVDEVVTFLHNKNIPALFDTPKHRPEFTSKKDETYYQVMFESPDKILFEVVYIGPT